MRQLLSGVDVAAGQLIQKLLSDHGDDGSIDDAKAGRALLFHKATSNEHVCDDDGRTDVTTLMMFDRNAQRGQQWTTSTKTLGAATWTL